jgi:hypothetical protein
MRYLDTGFGHPGQTLGAWLATRDAGPDDAAPR